MRQFSASPSYLKALNNFLHIFFCEVEDILVEIVAMCVFGIARTWTVVDSRVDKLRAVGLFRV